MTAHCYCRFGAIVVERVCKLIPVYQKVLVLSLEFLPTFPQARNYINSLPHMPKRNFADVFIGANPLGNESFSLLKAHCLPLVVSRSCCHLSPLLAAFQAVDLLEKMLVLDTDKRITASTALAHPYFAQYHDPDDEPEADPYDQSFESRELEIEEWKSKLVKNSVQDYTLKSGRNL